MLAATAIILFPRVDEPATWHRIVTIVSSSPGNVLKEPEIKEESSGNE
jgi:hypothetical protein